jgi:hypothetical protein
MSQTTSEVKYSHRIAPCPAYDVAGTDQLYAYLDNLHMPTVIIQVGERVIRASFHRYSESTEIPIEVWVQAVAEGIS